MSNYKVQFIGKNKKAITDEILVTADSNKQAVREACRIGKLDYPAEHRAKVTKIDLKPSPPPVKKGGDKSESASAQK